MMVKDDENSGSQADDMVEVTEMEIDESKVSGNLELSFKNVWGGNKVIVRKSTTVQMRAWAGLVDSPDHAAILGTGNLIELVHIATVLSISDKSEPDSLKSGSEGTKEIANMQSLDRVAKNEIAAIELLLKERYDGQDVVLIERLSAHVQRGVDSLEATRQELALEEVTILDLLQAISPDTFEAPVGITPVHNTLDEFI